MKLLIASDIHGSLYYSNELKKAIDNENPDKIILLGDLLYHGPRNNLPCDYQPKEVINFLNTYKEKILCARGNCDTEVDQMVLNFPIMSDYLVLMVDGICFYFSHGHKYNIDNPLPLSEGDIFISGHTHIPSCKEKDGVLYLNPGSISIPKENTPHSYLIYENKMFTWKNMDGETYMNQEI
ncbi:MAG: phosphodiesterase [Clostridia bacterium]|nr:phosphodiesterase [Clostridia bacterium]